MIGKTISNRQILDKHPTFSRDRSAKAREGMMTWQGDRTLSLIVKFGGDSIPTSRPLEIPQAKKDLRYDW